MSAVEFELSTCRPASRKNGEEEKDVSGENGPGPWREIPDSVETGC